MNTSSPKKQIDFHALHSTHHSSLPPPSHTNRTTTTTLPLPSLSTHTHPHVHHPTSTTTTIPFIAASQSRIVDGVHTSIGRGKRETKQQHSSTTTSQSVSRSITQKNAKAKIKSKHTSPLNSHKLYSRKGCTMSSPASSSQ